MNETPDSVFEQPLIDILVNDDHEVETVSDSNLTSFDFSGYDILISRAPEDSYSSHPASSFLSDIDMPVMSFSRHDVRNAFNMGGSSGTRTQSVFDLTPDSNFDLAGYSGSVQLYNSQTGHAVWSLSSDTETLALDGDEIGIAYRFRSNGYIAVGSSMHRGDDLTQEGEEVLLSLIWDAVEATP